MPDAARSSGDKHTLAQKEATVAKGAQSCQSRDRKSHRLGKAERIGQRDEAVGWRRNTLRPPRLTDQPNDARSLFRSTPVGGSFDDDPRNIFSKAPALLSHPELDKFAAMQGGSVDSDQSLIGCWLWLSDSMKCQRILPGWCIHKSQHLSAPFRFSHKNVQRGISYSKIVCTS